MQLCDEIFLKKPLAAVFEFFARDVFHPHIHRAHMQTKKIQKEKNSGKAARSRYGSILFSFQLEREEKPQFVLILVLLEGGREEARRAWPKIGSSLHSPRLPRKKSSFTTQYIGIYGAHLCDVLRRGGGGGENERREFSHIWNSSPFVYT